MHVLGVVELDLVQRLLVAALQPALVGHDRAARLLHLGLALAPVERLHLLQRVAVLGDAKALAHHPEQVDQGARAKQLVDLLLAGAVPHRERLQRLLLVACVVVDVAARVRRPASAMKKSISCLERDPLLRAVVRPERRGTPRCRRRPASPPRTGTQGPCRRCRGRPRCRRRGRPAPARAAGRSRSRPGRAGARRPARRSARSCSCSAAWRRSLCSVSRGTRGTLVSSGSSASAVMVGTPAASSRATWSRRRPATSDRWSSCDAALLAGAAVAADAAVAAGQRVGVRQALGDRLLGVAAKRPHVGGEVVGAVARRAGRFPAAPPAARAGGPAAGRSGRRRPTAAPGSRSW